MSDVRDLTLEVRNLTKFFKVKGGAREQFGPRGSREITAVDDVSLQVRRHETLGIVGESGSGKSTLGRLIACLEQPTAGKILFKGEEVTALQGRALRTTRRGFQVIFQDPYSTLNPRMRVGRALAEALLVHKMCRRSEAKRRVDGLLGQVEMSARVADHFPAHLSGGQRQRIGIARAIAVQPDLIVADEPVSSLDMSAQAQILNLINKLKRELGTSWVFISHNLATVRQVSDRIGVMYLGRIVEEGPARSILTSPLHPYTQALLVAVPQPDPRIPLSSAQLKGEPTHWTPTSTGCRLYARCPLARPFCRTHDPKLASVADDHLVACWAVTDRLLWEHGS